MFADDKSIENFQQLFFEFKKYLELQKEYTKLELTEKLTILLSTLIMIVILIILGMVALFYLLFGHLFFPKKRPVGWLKGRQSLLLTWKPH